MFIKVKIRNYEYYVYCYELIFHHEKTLIFLHGWNNDHTSFKEVYNKLDYRYNIIALDFIGFGKSDMVKEPLNLNDYSTLLKEVINYYKDIIKLKNIYLIGHSFGGRVIIKYLTELNNKNNNYNSIIKGIYLSSSAGIRHKNTKVKYKIISYKIKKRILKMLSFFSLKYLKKYQKFITSNGSNDYIGLNNLMKKTMTNVIKEDLFKKLAFIKVKTLITWGEFDEITPFEDAYTFLNCIPSSRLIVFHKSAHFPHLSENEKYVEVIDDALQNYFIS